MCATCPARDRETSPAVWSSSSTVSKAKQRLGCAAFKLDQFGNVWVCCCSVLARWENQTFVPVATRTRESTEQRNEHTTHSKPGLELKAPRFVFVHPLLCETRFAMSLRSVIQTTQVGNEVEIDFNFERVKFLKFSRQCSFVSQGNINNFCSRFSSTTPFS